MKSTKVFSINGELIELLIFEKNDRVEIKNNETLAMHATGLVEGTQCDGYLVSVIWDKEKFEPKSGGEVELGKLWTAKELKLINS